MRKLVVTLVFAAIVRGETYTLTLRQAVEQALKQNPDITLARLDESKALEAVRVAKDPFTPRITVGSGLAYSSGFPMSIEGAAPSVVQARATQFIFNRQQSYVIAQAKEDAHGATLATAAKKEEVAFRTASLFLDAERAARIGEMQKKEVESLEKVEQTISARVQEGRELPLASKRAAVNLARARQALEILDDDQAASENLLAVALGYNADDRVRPAAEQRALPELPTEDAAVESALESSQELRRIKSQIVSKGLEIRGERAARLPRIDLVAQYGLFARFNNYEDFFRKFQRNNGQLGISFQLPLLPGPGVSAMTAQTQAEITHLRVELNQTRNRIIFDLRQGYRELRKADTAREVARLDLEAAREQLSVGLAQMQEGRVSLREVEEARVNESNKWIAFYDAQYAVERAKWSLLRQTGELLAALR